MVNLMGWSYPIVRTTLVVWGVVVVVRGEAKGRNIEVIS